MFISLVIVVPILVAVFPIFMDHLEQSVLSEKRASLPRIIPARRKHR